MASYGFDVEAEVGWMAGRACSFFAFASVSGLLSPFPSWKVVRWGRVVRVSVYSFYAYRDTLAGTAGVLAGRARRSSSRLLA